MAPFRTFTVASGYFKITVFCSANGNFGLPQPSLRANGSRECAPDDRLREAIHEAAK
jgi:hypothetical protein